MLFRSELAKACAALPSVPKKSSRVRIGVPLSFAGGAGSNSGKFRVVRHLCATPMLSRFSVFRARDVGQHSGHREFRHQPQLPVYRRHVRVRPALIRSRGGRVDSTDAESRHRLSMAREIIPWTLVTRRWDSDDATRCYPVDSTDESNRSNLITDRKSTRLNSSH